MHIGILRAHALGDEIEGTTPRVSLHVDTHAVNGSNLAGFLFEFLLLVLSSYRHSIVALIRERLLKFLRERKEATIQVNSTADCLVSGHKLSMYTH